MYGFISEIINQLPAVPVLQVVWVDGGNSKHLGFLDRVPWLVLRVRNPRTKETIPQGEEESRITRELETQLGEGGTRITRGT